MEVSAKVTSKGQITLPKPLREALGLKTGDEIVFRVEPDRAILAKTPDFLDLAGAVPVPAHKRGTPWDQVRSRTRAARAKARA
jgi:antitoxin PrlF